MKIIVAFIVACFTFAAVQAAQFPLTMTHKFGTITIEEKPQRVASLDYNGADNILALGVQPVTVRYWYGDYENSVWPWAQDVLTTTPEILKGELNFEQIAATKPDVIIAIWSGITAEDYDRLSLIAPVVAVPEGMGDYAMTWYDLALTAGKVLGEEANANAMVGRIRDSLKVAAQNHPEWKDKTAAAALAWAEGSVGAYTSNDVRSLLLSDLGFKAPQAIDDMIIDNDFWVTFSLEDLSALDNDVLIWLTDGTTTHIDSLAARPFLNVVKEDHEVFFGYQSTGAFSHGSLLSLPVVIDELIKELEAVIPK